MAHIKAIKDFDESATVAEINSPDNLVDIANKAKDYLFTILDSDSAQYKAIAKIKFRKR